ncbi:MAG: hypothetical protein C0626_07175 [Arcobacter sp.]|nr:MAG: hypothetical protein C0626_07175 [Arcobacter sp.]
MIILKKDIDTYDNIYKTILRIKEEFRINQVISIIFHNNIKFIDPLFLILILNLHDKYRNKKVLVIDILDLDYSSETIKDYENKNKIQEEKNKNFNSKTISIEKKIDEKTNFNFPQKDNRQHHVYRMLLEFLDTGYFVKEKLSDFKWNKYINDYENKYYKDIEKRNKDYPKILANKINKNAIVDSDTEEVIYKNIFFYFSKEHNDSLFQNNDETRHLLPIFKINNFSKVLFNDSIHYNDIYTKKDDRKEIFEGLIKNVNDDFSRKEFEDYLEKIFKIVKPNNQSNNLTNLIPPLKNLLFECIDNIKKHTNKHTNGYFCFYYDSVNKQFKIIIYDDFTEGFLNTYKKTLEDELVDLEKRFDITNVDEKIKKPFLDSIFELNKVKNQNDTEIDHLILKKIFNKKGVFEAHQIPRIIMHFGIPTLVKIINEVGGEFFIRLHRKIDEKKSLYYCLDNKNNIKDTSINGLDGTHIYITIPENAIYKMRKAQPLNLKDSDLINISEKKEIIEEKIKKFISINDTKNESKYRILDYNNYFEKNPNNTISDFLRDLYYFSYKLNILDVLVINFPIKEFELYLQNLVYILFFNKEYNEESIIPLNVVFFNKTSLDIVFIGGRNYSEFYNSNKLISEHYGKYYNKITDVLIDTSNTLKNNYATTEFFYKTNNDIVVLPFELYEKCEVSIQHLIMNNLNDNKQCLHVDVKKGIHVSEFYKFDIIFQSSRFIDRIVHKILERIKLTIEDLDKKNIKFIGVGKYSNLLLATLYRSLNKNIDEYYLVLDDLIDQNEQNCLNEYMENNKEADAFFIFTPVTFDGTHIKKEIINKYNNQFIFWINTIEITLETENKVNINNYYTLLELQLKSEKYFKVNEKEGCKLCNSENELPLYNISKRDNFSIENCYFDDYKKKKLKPYLDIKDVKWADSIYFGHIKRDNNHYLYYTKTIQFFNRNNAEIVNFLKSIKIKVNGQYNISENEIIIITPMHSTHNKFLTVVNTIVFDGRATILQIDLKKDGNIFYNENDIEENTLFFYVDDEISSGTTIQHIYTLFKSNNQIRRFNGIIILIDRMLEQDENSIEHLIDSKITKAHEAIHLFAKLEIKPIKTTKYEECFLCKRKEEYKKLLEYTVLDINRFQIAKRISKLNIINHTTIDFEDGLNQNSSNKIDINRKIKDYIKMIAVDYIHRNFDLFNRISNGNYDEIFREYITLEKKFTDLIYPNIIKYFYVINKYEKIFIQICAFEASIALIKALSFPKIVYFKEIRYLATVVLIKKIEEYIKKEPLANVFDKKMISQLSNEQEKESNKFFIQEYSNKLNINYMNVLYVTAGYLNIQNILNIKNLEYYFNVSIETKEKQYEHILLQPYQFAVKMVSMQSIDKSKYLDKQIELFFQCRENVEKVDCTDYTLIEALTIENNYSISKDISSGVNFSDRLQYLLKDSDKSLTEKTSKCKLYIEKVIYNNFNDKRNDIKVESIFINENIYTKYDKYESYLDNLKFIDILDNFNEIDDENPNLKYINRIVKGALSKKPEKAMELKEDSITKEIEDIDNTWSNIYVQDFLINSENKNSLLIRLVDIDIEKLDNIKYTKSIENLWYKPIGCMAISCSENKIELLNIAKIILSIQNDLVKFIKEEFSHETFREILKRKDEEKRNDDIAKDYAMQISAINHSFKDQIDLRSKIDSYLNGTINNELERDEYLKLLGYFSYGLHHLSSLTSVKPNKMKKRLTSIDITDSLNTYIQDGFFDGITKFISSTRYFMDNINQYFSEDSLDITSLNSDSFKLNLEQVAHMSHICFELIFNAIKYYNIDEKKPVIKISSLTDGEGIMVENMVKEDFTLDAMNLKLEKKSRIGVKFIEEILNDQDYIIEYEFIERYLSVIIKKDKNNDK